MHERSSEHCHACVQRAKPLGDYDNGGLMGGGFDVHNKRERLMALFQGRNYIPA